MSKAISAVFDVMPVDKPESAVVVVETKTVSDDATLARSNLKSLIETGGEALRDALDVAQQSEQPRAYEVVTAMITAIADLNTKILQTHQMEQKILNDTRIQAQPVPVNNGTVNHTTNNVIFNGTPEELDQLLDKQKGKP